jgi:hypothetical protein
MSKIDDFHAAVAGLARNADARFVVVGDALTELASDVAGLNKKIADLTDKVANPDIQAEIDAVNAESQRITDQTGAIAQAIRDAIPTPEASPATQPAETAPAGTAPSTEPAATESAPAAEAPSEPVGGGE